MAAGLGIHERTYKSFGIDGLTRTGKNSSYPAKTEQAVIHFIA